MTPLLLLVRGSSSFFITADATRIRPLGTITREGRAELENVIFLVSIVGAFAIQARIGVVSQLICLRNCSEEIMKSIERQRPLTSFKTISSL